MTMVALTQVVKSEGGKREMQVPGANRRTQKSELERELDRFKARLPLAARLVRTDEATAKSMSGQHHSMETAVSVVKVLNVGEDCLSGLASSCVAVYGYRPGAEKYYSVGFEESRGSKSKPFLVAHEV